MNLNHGDDTLPEKPKQVVVLSKNNDLAKEVAEIAVEFFDKLGTRARVLRIDDYKITLDLKLEEPILFISDESIFEGDDEIVFLKTLKDKFASSTLVHLFKKYSPVYYNDLIIKSAAKFVKEDFLIESNLRKSLNAIYSKELNHES